MGGRGPRASTVYESPVILSIQDTPPWLKFCRHSGGRNTGPENHRVFHRPPIVARPAAHGRKPQALIQPACCGVRFAHLEVNDPHPPVAQLLEQPLHQRSSDTAAPVHRGDAQVQDLPFVPGPAPLHSRTASRYRIAPSPTTARGRSAGAAPRASSRTVVTVGARRVSTASGRNT